MEGAEGGWLWAPDNTRVIERSCLPGLRIETWGTRVQGWLVNVPGPQMRGTRGHPALARERM